MTTPPAMEDRARAAYDSMREEIHGVSTLSGKILPTWEELDSTVQDAWVAAIQAVENAANPTPLP